MHEQPTSRASCSLQARRHVEVSARSCRWVCWGGSGSARIPVGGVRASRDARAFMLTISTTSPKYIVGACSGPTFRCTPDPQTHIPSPSYTRPTIGMLNLVLKIPSSVSGSSRRSHRAKPRARSIWADFAVPGP